MLLGAPRRRRAGGALNPIIGAVSYERVPTGLRARVLPAINSLAWAGIPLGGLLGGWLAGAAGVTAALLAGGGLYLLATLGPFVFPARREMDRRSGAPAEPPAVRSEPTGRWADRIARVGSAHAGAGPGLGSAARVGGSGDPAGRRSYPSVS